MQNWQVPGNVRNKVFNKVFRSWTPVNAGTSGRALCASVGNTDQPSVEASNQLTARTLEFENPFELHESINRNDLYDSV